MIIFQCNWYIFYFQDIKDSQEPMMFPLEKILFALATDSKATRSILESIKPKVTHFITQEVYIDVIVSFCL